MADVNPPEVRSAQPPTPQQVYYVERKSGNGMGVAGFILSILALLLCWVPVIDWVLWILGAIFSLIGVFKAPRGLAIAGLVISFIDIILLVVLLGLFAGAIASAMMI